MYRNTTVGSSALGVPGRLLAQACRFLPVCLTLLCLALFGSLNGNAQSTSGGGIQGTISDPSGAAVPNAQVTATNTQTGVQTVRKTNGHGIYSIQPLQVGVYNVEVVAKGFQKLLQENINVDNAQVVGLNLKLSIGEENTTVTVTDAPPFLDTTDSTLGGTIENELYSQLPLTMNGGPRDPTAFQYLMPGVQENPAANGNVTDASGNLTTSQTNGNSGIYGGTGQTNLNENYVEGVPVNNINQQGTSNTVSQAVSVDAVDQFSVQTNGASASFGGAGSTNYTIKSGGNQFHGDVFDYVRNTAFDTWGYFTKVPLASTGTARKPYEHQNNYGGTLSGPILKDKLFFFGSYEGFHYTTISNTPQYLTIPTLAERTGDFTDVMGTNAQFIGDPTQSYPHPTSTMVGLKNGVPTNNVIPASKLSPISLYLESALPQPSNLSTFNNYLAALPKENSDYDVDVKIDYTLNGRNKFSLTAIGGNIGYGGQPFYDNYTQVPVPYAGGSFTNQKTATGVFKYTFIASQTMINSLSYGYTRVWGQKFPLTGPNYPNLCSVPGGTPGPCNASAAGITNLPPGNASNTMPKITWSQGNGPSAPATWGSDPGSGPVASNSYTIIDNLQWIKGRHNITIGAQVQWLGSNAAAYSGYSNVLQLNYRSDTTYWCAQNLNGTAICQNNLGGDAYAAFLMGAAYSGTIETQDITDIGARYRPMAPYVQDNWQVSPKLTLNIGLRFDYLQPYHEVHNRISFLNTSMTNPITGTPGVVAYAGFPNSSTPSQYAPYMCHCTTPVHPYEKNFEPRVGFSYAYTPTTVFSGGFSLNLTHAGGVGGFANATTGPGNNNEFSQSTSYSQSGTTGDAAFFLNPNISPSDTVAAKINPKSSPAQGTQLNPDGTTYSAVPGNPFAAIFPWVPASTSISPLASTGNYNYIGYFPDHLADYGCSTSSQFCQPGDVNFADPYYGGRGPQYLSYNAAVQHMINKKAVLTIAYAGSQTHFLPGGAGRGYATNEFSPDYIQLIKGAYNAVGFYGSAPPYPLFSGPSATVAQSLKPFPQFGTMHDIWGDTGNASSNQLQISVIQRPWHNLSGLANYTRSKEIDDTGNHRTQYPIGPQDGNFTKEYAAGRIDRGPGRFNQTNAVNVAFNYIFPIGRGQAFFATNRLMGLIAGGWEINGIYKYRDGYPIQVTGPACTPNVIDGGTCMPDYTPGFDKRSARINGRWGRGPGANAANLNQISYINPQAFECPDSSPLNNTYTCGNSNSPNVTFKIGNAARSAPYGLTGPGWWDVDAGIRRTFNVRETATLHLTFQIEADVSNLTNSTFFNLSSSQWDNSAFGKIGGQNESIQPRDWQFEGRFRF